MKKLNKIVLLLVLVVALVMGLVTYQKSQNSDSSNAAGAINLDASGCTSIEVYDEQTGECTYECDTDQECDKKAQLVEEELNNYFEDATSKLDKTPANETDSEKNAKTYAFNGSSFTPQLETPEEKEVWGYFYAIADAGFVKEYIANVSFYNDGASDTAAHVIQNDADSSKWNLSVNMAFASDKKELIFTLVHEYAHIFSLNKTAIDRNVTGTCPRLQIAEGCALEGSVISKFNSAFWSNIDADPDNGEFGKYYQSSPADFVSEYAGTNAVEDFAETFAYATLRKNDSVATGGVSKIAFAEQEPSTKKESTRIVAELGQSLVRKKLIK
jgi:hypothetical protein